MAPAAIELARDARQLAQLRAADLAIGRGDAQHRRVALHVPAVLQPQRTELVVAQFAAQVALELVAELRGTRAHELTVEVGIRIHQ